jgi:hypothetical protein
VDDRSQPATAGGFWDASKKSLTDGLQELKDDGKTSHPLLAAILTAQAVNLAHNGPVVAAWEVGGLPEDWIDACIAVAKRKVFETAKAKANNQAESYKTAWRSNHPGYGRRQ